jgi:hypothetical protein
LCDPFSSRVTKNADFFDWIAEMPSVRQIQKCDAVAGSAKDGEIAAALRNGSGKN